MDKKNIHELAANLKSGAIGVIPTDTIYGIAASIHNKEAVERVYRRTGRPSSKPFIILISGLAQLKEFEIELKPGQIKSLESVWPGPVSVIIPVRAEKLSYLHRGKNSLAFRLPDLEWLRSLVDLSGPIIATSANLSGLPTPRNIDEIKQQLPALGFYYEGTVGTSPSKLLALRTDGKLEQIGRQ